MQVMLAQCGGYGLALRRHDVKQPFLAAVDDMAKALHVALKGAGLRLFALVDGALLLDLPLSARRLWASQQSHSLLVGASDDVVAAGPLLYQIEAEHPDTGLLKTLCDETTGRITASFIVSDQDPRELARRLSDLVNVRLDDGSEMLMRFFDPRVLPFWIDLVAPAYREPIAGAVAKWIFWKHDFCIRTVDFKRTAGKSTSVNLPMKVALDVENALIDACFPFTMIERMRAEDAVALERVAVPQRYAFFHAQIERAQAHGLSAQGELEAYCAMAIEFGAAFDEDRQVRTALGGIKQGQTFDAALAALTNDDWQQVRGVR